MINSSIFLISNYIPYLTFTEKTNVYLNSNYIKPIVTNFFETRNIKDYKFIQVESSISDIDFDSIEFDYFYKYLLEDINRNNDGTISFSTKFTISFDKELCNKFCDRTRTYYENIMIGSNPVFYFIYVDFHEVINFIRKIKCS
jgi:hypothetical protein